MTIKRHELVGNVYLIDTSVWIDYFNDRDNESVIQFQNILDKKESYGICSAIYQEILQGAKSETDFEKLQSYLCTQIFYHPKDPINTYTKSAKLYFQCRRNGVTIRSTIDCLIAQISIEHDLTLLHNDNDFKNMAKIFPKLKQLSGEL